MGASSEAGHWWTKNEAPRKVSRYRGRGGGTGGGTRRGVGVGRGRGGSMEMGRSSRAVVRGDGVGNHSKPTISPNFRKEKVDGVHRVWGTLSMCTSGAVS